MVLLVSLITVLWISFALPCAGYPGEHPTFVQGLEGESVTIDCPRDQHMEWFRKYYNKTTNRIQDGDRYAVNASPVSHDRPITDDPQQNYSLTIHNLTMNDKGQYICRSSGSNRTIILNVNGTGYVTNNSKLYVYVEKPVYGLEGRDASLICKRSYKIDTIDWLVLTDNSTNILHHNERYDMQDIHRLNSNNKTSTLTIRNLTSFDSGLYLCRSTRDHNINDSAILHVFGAIEQPPRPTIARDTYDSLLYGETLEMSCSIIAQWADIYTLNWIIPSRGFTSINPSISITLTVTNISADNIGWYTCLVTNNLNNQISTGRTYVSDIYEKPVLILNDTFVGTDNVTMTTLTYKSVRLRGYTLAWYYRPCTWIKSEWFPVDGQCAEDWTPIEFQQINDNSVAIPARTLPGQVQCEATHGTEATYSATANVYIQERAQALVLETSNSTVMAESVMIIECYASMYIFAEEPSIMMNGDLVTPTDDIFVSISMTDHMFRKKIRFANVGFNHDGMYSCEARTFHNQTRIEQLEIRVIGLSGLRRTKLFSNNVKSVAVKLSETLVISCDVVGNPVPTVEWFKNGEPIVSNSSLLMANDTRLQINRTSLDDSGAYVCRVSNEFGWITKQFEVSVDATSSAFVMIALVSSMCFLSFVIVIMFVFYRRELRKRRLFKRFIDGNEDGMNLELTITEQGDLLPYDTKYDFSHKNLKLGMRLGVGAFGEVVKGVALGITGGEDVATTVAVKRVKNGASVQDVRSLIAEMKIMIFVGKHLNILNLLGVVRENLNQRELLVITEFCMEGNLRDFILRNRTCFVNQIDMETGEINYSITAQSIIDYHDYINVEGIMSHSTAEFSNRTSGDNISPIVAQQTTNDYVNVEGHMSHFSADEFKNLGPGFVDQSSMHMKPHTISTTDLVCWSFQVSQGMKFLARQGVLHGDLAARNILLANDNVVKIADFGLSRWLRAEEDYTKASTTEMPYKWMAIESHKNKAFNTSSDIWSYGVLMWEMFSLGAIPYVDIPNDELLVCLESGYRLAEPTFTTRDIYNIMLDCWNVSMLERPRFNEICDRLTRVLPIELVQNFHDRNAEYVMLNVKTDRSPKVDKNIALPLQIAPCTTITMEPSVSTQQTNV